MKLKNAILVLALVGLTSGAWAQQCTEYKWPAEQAKAEKYVEAFKAAYNEQNYKGAVPGLQWMFAHAPQWHSDLYVMALDTYDKLSTQEVDPATKQGYIDSLLIIYDLRIKNCGDETNVLNRKAISAAKYNGQNKEKVAEALAIFDKTFEVSGNNVLDNNLLAYMDVIKNDVELTKGLTEEQVEQRYVKLLSVIDAKVKKAEEQNKTADIEKYKKVVGAIDAKLAKATKLNCGFAKRVYVPRFKANPNDLIAARRIFTIMLADKCTDEAAWLEATEALFKASPDFSVSKELTSKYAQLKNFDKANASLAEVQAKATSPTEKAWVEILKGDIEFQKGNKAAARDQYKKALTVDVNSKDANEHLGDLYASSAADCSKTPGSAEEKLIYIAAFQYYKNSGNREKMEQTLAKYPTNADITKAGWKAGESKKLACWIDEAVVVKAKKE